MIFTVKINELNSLESKTFLKFLFEHMTRPEVILRHRWQAGDAVLWDNRSLIHRGVNDYDDTAIRHMHRTTIEGI